MYGIRAIGFIRRSGFLFLFVLMFTPTIAQNFLLSRLQDIEPTAGDGFSAGIALSDSEVFISSPNYDYFKTERYGVVHVFRKNRVGE